LHNTSLPYGCGNDCRYRSKFCGNGILNPGEQCDDGERNSDAPGARCRLICSFARCGDGILDPSEQCDDRNRLSGDGCSSLCTIQAAGMLAIGFPPKTPIDISSTAAGVIAHLSPLKLPLASVLPLDLQPIRTQTGPAAIAVMSAGAALGYAWTRRKKSR